MPNRKLPPNPVGYRSLTDPEVARLKERHQGLWSDPRSTCLTCNKERTGSATFRTRQDNEIVIYDCSCVEQWKLHRWLLNSGVDTRYQRYSWNDVTHIGEDAQIAVMEYMTNQAMIRQGAGLTLWSADRGCIQGDAEILLNRAGKGFRLPLSEVVHRFNGGRSYGGKYWRPDIPTYVQHEAGDGTVRLTRLVEAWESGVKQTYTVTTTAGLSLRATDEHPFLTERGWLRLDQLTVGDLLHTRGGQAAGQPKEPKHNYRQVYRMHNHPYGVRAWNDMAYPEHRLVAEAAENQIDFKMYVKQIRSGDTTGLIFFDPAVYAVHHRDSNWINNESSNLQVMTHSEHHRLHADEGKTRSVLYKVALDPVVSVVPFGEEMTYDIEVAEEPHNFIANGIVVHNTGKTLLGSLLAKGLMARGNDTYFTQFNEMIDQFTSGWRDEDERRWFIRRIRNVGFLVVDDMGRESKGRENITEAMFDTVIRARVAACKPTIITTNYTPQQLLQGYGSNVMSLLSEVNTEIEVFGSDYRPISKENMIKDAADGIVYPFVVS